MVYDVIIIGAGPAGMSAGIYICRKKLSALILSKDIGGQTARSWDVENYLGFSMITGGELVAKFKEHLDNFKCVNFKSSVEIKEIKKSQKNKNTKTSGLFEVLTKKGERFYSRTIIVASGKIPRELGVPGEKVYKNKGLTYCATCDAPLFAGKDVAVVGDGDAALDAAWQLTKIATTVYLLIWGPKFRADLDKVLLGRVLRSPVVKVIYDVQTTKISGEKFVNNLSYQDKKTGETKDLAVQGIFVEIGSIPATEFIKKLVKVNKRGEIIIDKANMTSAPGIFAAGDVTDVIEKQVIIAAGEGAKAAIAASNYLSRNLK